MRPNKFNSSYKNFHSYFKQTGTLQTLWVKARRIKNCHCSSDSLVGWKGETSGEEKNKNLFRSYRAYLQSRHSSRHIHHSFHYVTRRTLCKNHHCVAMWNFISHLTVFPAKHAMDQLWEHLRHEQLQSSLFASDFDGTEQGGNLYLNTENLEIKMK